MTAVPSTELHLQPVAAVERVAALDVVRGFALFGVLIANLVWWTQEVPLNDAQREALPTAAIDEWARAAVALLVDGKFITLFSFLFGLGFALQLERAEARGSAGVQIFLRRMLVLLGIGVLHCVFIWGGDILHMYALLGLLLPCFRKLSKRSLLVLGLLVAIVLPLLVRWIGPAPGEARAMWEEDQVEAWRALHGSYLDVVGYHLSSYVPFVRSGVVFWFLVLIFGRFLLGMWAARVRLLQEPERHRRLLVWMSYLGLAIGLCGNGVALAVELGAFGPKRQLSMAARSGFTFLHLSGVIALSGAYLALLLRALQRPALRRPLLLLGNVGRMALSNYLCHSVLYLLLFSGFGANLVGKIGALHCVLLACAIFAVQIALSRWWLRRFRFGPAEWVWRSLTYGARQPMRGSAMVS